MSNDMLEMFIFENVQLTEKLEEVMIEGEHAGGLNSEHINEVFRIMHTIKGSAAMMEYDEIAALAHKIEDMFFFIREHGEAEPDWGEITDICLEAIDFFKQEVSKIQDGKPSDGDMSETLDRIAKCMDSLLNEGQVPENSGGEGSGENDGDEDDQAKENLEAEDGLNVLNVYKCQIFFEPGCKMENIRAYTIVSTLNEYADKIETEPHDLLEDCSDEIIASGVKLSIHSSVPLKKIESVISEALFVKTFDIVVDGENNASPADAPAGKSPEDAPPKEAKPKKKKAKSKKPEIVEEPTPAAVVEEPPLPIPAVPAEPQAAEIKQRFISVNVDKLDKLMDLMGEIVISVSMVVNNPDLDGLELDNFEKASVQLLKNTGELQDIIMSVRMLPISSTFHKMSRIVRDTAKKLGKEAELVILGEETEVDKNIIDHLSDPLMHIIRNSMDHGIEDSKEERINAGKPPAGKIVLEARNSGSDVIIYCSDDGKGLSREKILNKARANGLLARPENEYTDKEVYQFIMNAGFSTNDAVTELSGRGVGMDVVKKNIEKVGGSVDLDSSPGEGMTVNIRIPLTLAILQSIEISVGKNNYLIPTLNIRETYKPKSENIIIDPDGNEMIMYRGECFSIVRLHSLFGVDTEIEQFEDGIMIMIEDDDCMTAVFADALVGEQQAVVKPIPNFITERIGQIYGISGCTLLGDGSISLIIDVKSLTH
ncbi:MAG: chemotaxis protein CheA [Oscillospiraceae bacterium]|nr:chemotaxis protein CheA [Oscillospiraceae bacterium]